MRYRKGLLLSTGRNDSPHSDHHQEGATCCSLQQNLMCSAHLKDRKVTNLFGEGERLPSTYRLGVIGYGWLKGLRLQTISSVSYCMAIEGLMGLWCSGGTYDSRVTGGYGSNSFLPHLAFHLDKHDNKSTENSPQAFKDHRLVFEFLPMEHFLECLRKPS